MSRIIRHLLLLALIGIAPCAFAAEPVEGRDYVELRPAQPTTSGDRIEVIEFFSYQCSHCDHFHGAFDAWTAKLPGDVAWRREPVVFGRVAWEASARAFHALSEMGKIDALNGPIFDAIHRQGMALDSEAALTRLVASRGVDADEFGAAYGAARDKLIRGQELAQKLKIQSVPSIVIAGRYVVAIHGGAAYDGQLRHVDALLERIRQEKVGKR